MKINRYGIWIFAILLGCGLATLIVFGQSLTGYLQSTLRIQPASSEETSPAFTGCGGVTALAVREDFEQQVTELVNQARAGEGLPPLKHASSLVEAARYHAADMSMDGYFEHDTFDLGSSGLTFTCAWYERVTGFYFPDWMHLSENIAAGQADPESAYQVWMGSAGHRGNILSRDAWEIGVGYAQGGALAHYWVQDFGRREGVFPIVINNEAALTETRDVDLYVYGEWQEMRLRNDLGAWSEWQPFQNRLPWKINTGNGEHQVWVELRSLGENASSSDSIILSEITPLSSLVDLPDSISFTYSLPQDKLYPAAYTITIQSSDRSLALEWSASVEGDWFQVSPGSGITPQAITIWPQDTSRLPKGEYSGTLSITASGPVQELESTQIIHLTLMVTDNLISYLFLPITTQ